MMLPLPQTFWDKQANVTTLRHGTVAIGEVCTCEHTHVYSGVVYDNCPYCNCESHSAGLLNFDKFATGSDFQYHKVIRRPKRNLSDLDEFLGI